VVPNHVGNAGTLYINLINQGMAGTFSFDASNAALSVLQMPVPQ
jgi:hypothetical protein